MRGNRMTWYAGLATICLLGLSAAASVGAQEVKGMITSRSGDQVIVEGSEGKTTVHITDETTVVDRRGLFGLQKEHFGPTVLIPGLKVKVKGSQDSEGKFVAKEITTDGDDIETSQMIAAGLNPTAEQVQKNVETLQAHQEKISTNAAGVAENKQNVAANTEQLASHKTQIEENMKDIQDNTQRFAALTDYDVKGETALKFAVGSTKLSKEDEDQLQQIAQTALATKGVLVEVVGYADSTGGAAMNTRLSEARAKTVVTYLFQQCNIPMRFIVAPGAMGEYGNVAPNETKEGRAENRRVTVKLLVNKGIAGSGI